MQWILNLPSLRKRSSGTQVAVRLYQKNVFFFMKSTALLELVGMGVGLDKKSWSKNPSNLQHFICKYRDESDDWLRACLENQEWSHLFELFIKMIYFQKSNVFKFLNQLQISWNICPSRVPQKHGQLKLRTRMSWKQETLSLLRNYETLDLLWSTRSFRVWRFLKSPRQHWLRFWKTLFFEFQVLQIEIMKIFFKSQCTKEIKEEDKKMFPK